MGRHLHRGRHRPHRGKGAWAYYGLQRLANNSTIFVAPQGLDNGWANAGGEDVTFVDDMLRRIEADLCVDTTQRFALGFSYGAAMQYALADSRATVFRAVAVQSGGQLSGCSGGTQPIAYLGVPALSTALPARSQGVRSSNHPGVLRSAVRAVAADGCRLAA